MVASTDWITLAEAAEILASRDRTRAGRTAPAHGLTLEHVFYAEV